MTRLLIIFSILAIVLASASAADLKVPGDYSTIQEAFNAASVNLITK